LKRFCTSAGRWEAAEARPRLLASSPSFDARQCAVGCLCYKARFGVDFLFAARVCRIVIARWEHFPHEADMGIRGFGATKAEAFEQAALAMTAVVTDTTGVEPREAVTVGCEAPDDELLLAEWLNSLIYEMATRKMLFTRFAVEIDGARLSAQAWGERVDVARHHPAVEIKGATYTALRVAHDKDGWVAQTVVDV
jgi:SHS2 domain-containing protein